VIHNYKFLLETFDDWTLAINNRTSVVTAYIDFSKAFDAVCHNKLLHKLAAYGMTGNLLSWIRHVSAILTLMLLTYLVA